MLNLEELEDRLDFTESQLDKLTSFVHDDMLDQIYAWEYDVERRGLSADELIEKLKDWHYRLSEEAEKVW